MSKQVFLGLLCSSMMAISSGVQAQASPYVHASLGSMQISSPESTGTALNLDGSRRKVAARLGVGVQLHPHFGIEATWFQLPSTTVPAQSGEAEYSGSVWTAAATARLPLNDSLDLIGRLGAGRSSVEASVPAMAYSSESRKRPVVWGFGASYRFSPNLAVTLTYDHLGTVGKYTTGSDVRARMVSAGVQFNF